jgi:hypothetical protein
VSGVFEQKLGVAQFGIPAAPVSGSPDLAARPPFRASWCRLMGQVPP